MPDQPGDIPHFLRWPGRSDPEHAAEEQRRIHGTPSLDHEKAISQAWDELQARESDLYERERELAERGRKVSEVILTVQELATFQFEEERRINTAWRRLWAGYALLVILAVLVMAAGNGLLPR